MFVCLLFSWNLSSPVTEQKNTDQVTLNCSVWTYGRCKHKVEWIHHNGVLNRDYSNLKTSQSSCSAAVTFIKSSYSHIFSSNFKCNITTDENKEQLFTFRPQSSGKKPGEIQFRKLLSTDVRKELLIS